MMLYICTVFYETIFHSIKVTEIREDTISMKKYHKGAQFSVFSACHLMMFHTCTKFHKNISVFQTYGVGTIS